MKFMNKVSLPVKIGAIAVGFLLLEAVLLFQVKLEPSPLAQRWLGKVLPSAKTTETTAAKAPVDFTTLNAQVLPKDGFRVAVKWGDLGQRLVSVGAIDLNKFKQAFAQRGLDEQQLAYLTQSGQEEIAIDQESATFWVDVLWALGLTNRSTVLDNGPMKTGTTPVGNFASTGGWTLGSKPATALYSSQNLIALTAEQEERVKTIADGVFRPCCNNPTSFPDCNHGMAALGLIELMVRDGATDEEIYKAALAFNSFWFPQTYLDLAYYFKTNENLEWSQVDAKKALSAPYSSGQGYQAIKKTLQPIPGQPQQGGSCGA